MGELQVSLIDEMQETIPVGVELNQTGYQTATAVGEKIYVIGGSEDGSNAIKVFDKSTEKWVVPAVMGKVPSISNGHSATLVNDDRILIFKKDSTPNDCTWFLEVDTSFVKEQKKILGTEVVAWSKGVKGDGPKPIVISGPSGVGKGTLIAKLMDEFPSMFGFSVSHTTRAPRNKEKNGVHYHFTERNEMEKAIQDGKFLESAAVHGNLYGTSIEAVDVVSDSGKRCILDIDVQGARSVRANSLDAIFIFVCPPSFEELEQRLRSRGTETEEQVQKRLRNARSELEQGKSSGLFDHILVNDNLENCYDNLKELLGLKQSTGDFPCKRSSEDCHVNGGHSISKMDQRVLVPNGNAEIEKASDKLLMFDASTLKGGAPGRTRGLNIYSFESSNGINGNGYHSNGINGNGCQANGINGNGCHR
ncbi:guanylate kinase [Ranunculus cassubicifolius]